MYWSNYIQRLPTPVTDSRSVHLATPSEKCCFSAFLKLSVTVIAHPTESTDWILTENTGGRQTQAGWMDT